MRKDSIDKNGYRLNVGIIIVNKENKVFWAKRVKEDSWQFPQGGIKYNEPIKKAMYRELLEEVGLHVNDIKIIAKTNKWIYYNVPENFFNKFNNNKKFYKGQKQIWFLLKLITQDSNIDLKRTNSPEFDSWQWVDYWSVVDRVIEFRRKTYLMALHELSSFLPIINSYDEYKKHHP